MNSKFQIILFICFSIFSLGKTKAQNSISVTKFKDKFSIPVDIVHANDARLFIVEKAGRIKIIKNGLTLDSTFLDIVTRVESRGNEQGLLGVTFHPNYDSTGWFYVNYINKKTPTQSTVSRFKVDPTNPDRADLSSEHILLTLTQPYSNHNGGCLKFGKDGYLYIGFGDGGSSNDPQGNGQNKKALLGKMLRIDVNRDSGYAIPLDNPFVKDTSTLDEIWDIGLRNPWRYSFDRLTGDLWIGDVGQGSWEEIDFEPANSKGGFNYGWKCWEGNHVFDNSCANRPGFTFPIIEYISDPTIEGCSVTGGFVYRGKKIPYLYGKYIYADYCSGKIWILYKDTSNRLINKLAYPFAANQISTFGEDSEGEIYFAAIGQGTIYKIEDTCNLIIKSTLIQPVCVETSDGSITISTNQNSSKYLWSTGDTSNVISNLSGGIYTLTLTSGECRIEKEFILNAPKPTQACITPPFQTQGCSGDSLLLIACDGMGDYQWYQNNIPIAKLNTKRIFVFEPGVYTVAYIDSLGCLATQSDSVQINIFPLPATPTLSILKDSLIAIEGYSSYRWFKNGQLFGGSISPYFILTSSGTYCYTVIDSNNCESLKSDSIVYIQVNTKNIDADSEIQIQPNPANNEISISYRNGKSLPEDLKFKISTSTGKWIDQLPTYWVDGKIMINIRQLHSGIYFIHFTEKDSELIKFIKIK